VTDPSNDRAMMLILVPSATVGFLLAFNLGAFGVIFFDRLLVLWVVSTVVLILSLVTELTPRHWSGRAVLLIPTVWLILSMVDSSGQTSRWTGCEPPPVSRTVLVC
jgi:hypothetical protein